MSLFIHSGNCRFCETGIATGAVDLYDKPLFTGDIVITFTERNGVIGSVYSLTVVVREDYVSFAGGEHRKRDEPSEFFVMGIRAVPMDEPGEWRVQKLKDHSDVIPGEHWRAYGFNYVDGDAVGRDMQMVEG